jgi:outer membrane receptor protein involved in Fe transport
MFSRHQSTTIFGTLCLVFFALVSFKSIAQADINGTLIGERDKEPLTFATVTIFNSQTKDYVKGAQTDIDGKFAFQAIPAGNYFIKVSYVGFEDFQKENLKVENGKNIDLETLVIKESGKMLEEVVVAGAKPAMELQMDRKVFNVGQSAISVGGTATDLLSNVPSLQVDMDGSVSLRGSSSVRILIDGKESAMAGNDITRLLQALPANAIERVEVITNPSAKYDAEGQSGIINIVLKKDARYGFNGAVTASVGSYGNAGAGFNLNYRQGKLNYFGNYNFNRRNMVGDSWNDTRFFESNARTQTNSESRRLGLNHGFGLGLDYYLTDKTVLGVSGNMSLRGNSRNEDIFYRYMNNPELVGDSERYSRQKEDDLGFDINVNFKQEFDRKGEELTANFAIGRDSEEGVNDFLQYYTLNRQLMENRRNETTESGSNTNIQLDYTVPFSEKSKFGTGYRTIIRTSDEKQYSTFLDSTNAMVPDYLISNDFDMKSSVHAVYVNYENQITKEFGFQVGLRAEQAYLDTEYLSYNPDLAPGDRTAKGRLDYFRLYPSVFLTRKFGDENQLQGSYTRRVNRPRGWQVNPFINVSDPMNIRQGNPNLMPEDIHSFELSYAKFWNKYTLTSSVYYRRMNDVVQSVVTSVEGTSGATFSRFENISRNEATGLELISQMNFTKNFDVTANANFFYSRFHGSEEFSILPTDGFNWNANAITNYRIRPNLSAQVRMEYRAPMVLAQGRSVEAFIVDAGLKLDVLKKKGTVNLNVRDLFNQRRWGGYTQTAQFYREHENRWMRRMVMVSFTYRIGGILNDNKKKNGQQNPGGGEFEGEGGFGGK